MKIADVADYNAVMKTLEIYCVEDCATNVEPVKKAFHEKAVMNGVARTVTYSDPSRTCMTCTSRSEARRMHSGMSMSLT